MWNKSKMKEDEQTSVYPLTQSTCSRRDMRVLKAASPVPKDNIRYQNCLLFRHYTPKHIIKQSWPRQCPFHAKMCPAIWWWHFHGLRCQNEVTIDQTTMNVYLHAQILHMESQKIMLRSESTDARLQLYASPTETRNSTGLLTVHTIWTVITECC